MKALVRLGENQKIRYLTGRQLGRVILRGDVVGRTKRLVKHDLINKNGLYREDTRRIVKDLLVRQLRSQPLRRMAKDSVAGFFKSENCQELFSFTLEENLVKEWIIDLFKDSKFFWSDLM